MSTQEGLGIRDEPPKTNSLIIYTLKRIGCAGGLRTLRREDISLNKIQLWEEEGSVLTALEFVV